MQIEELVSAIAGVTEAVQNPQELLDTVSSLVVERSKPLTPRLTGALQESEHYELQGQNQAVLMADAGHALYVHDGTYKMPARPFFTEGIEGSIPEVEANMAEWGGKVLDGASG